MPARGDGSSAPPRVELDGQRETAHLWHLDVGENDVGPGGVTPHEVRAG